jgi:hypothetical protein
MKGLAVAPHAAAGSLRHTGSVRISACLPGRQVLVDGSVHAANAPLDRVEPPQAFRGRTGPPVSSSRALHETLAALLRQPGQPWLQTPGDTTWHVSPSASLVLLTASRDGITTTHPFGAAPDSLQWTRCSACTSLPRAAPASGLERRRNGFNSPIEVGRVVLPMFSRYSATYPASEACSHVIDSGLDMTVSA